VASSLELRWYVCDLLTGVILTELPLSGVDRIVQVIAREDSQTFNLATADPSCPDNWADLLVPGKSMIVLTVDGEPAVAWHVEDKVVGTPQVSIPAVTLETCLHRTNVPDLEDTMDDAEGCVVLCAPLVVRFGFIIEHTATGNVSDFSYSNAEDRNLLDVMHERMQSENPLEWRIQIRWADPATKQAFTKVLEIRPRIGIDRPDAVFDLNADGRGNIESYTRGQSYAPGKDATMMIGTSEGSGSSRPVTDPIYSDLVAAGWPTWEEWSNFTGLDTGSVEQEDDALKTRTTARLEAKKYGTTAWTIVAGDSAPRPGVDYFEGDTIHIDVAPQGKQDPTGGTAALRILGWELDPLSRQSTPIIWDGGDES